MPRPTAKNGRGMAAPTVGVGRAPTAAMAVEYEAGQERLAGGSSEGMQRELVFDGGATPEPGLRIGSCIGSPKFL